MGLIRDHKEARPTRFLKDGQVLLLLPGMGTQPAEPIDLLHHQWGAEETDDDQAAADGHDTAQVPVPRLGANAGIRDCPVTPPQPLPAAERGFLLPLPS